VTGDRALRAALVEVARALHARGWVANHDGNVTARVGGGRFVATPTATSKGKIADRGLIEVDATGKVLGPGKAFGEMPLHLLVFERRPDVGAVVHAHPPHASALACAGSTLLERPFMAEAVVSIGPRIPTVPFAAPGKPAREALAPYVADHDAVLLGNHGAMAWGKDLEQAYLRLELVEHLARIATLAQAVGGVRPLPDAVLPALLEARAKAGLGQAADRALASTGPARVVACAPAPHANVAVVAPGGDGRDRSRVAELVREELTRALRR
jgi:L-fuculose-phosphate aldolase